MAKVGSYKTQNQVYWDMLQSLPERERQWIWEELRRIALERIQENREQLEIRKQRFIDDQHLFFSVATSEDCDVPAHLLCSTQEINEFEQVKDRPVKLDVFLKQRGY